MDTMKEMGVVAEIALMFARIWGVRAMVRIINPIRRNLLAKVEQRLTIEFNKSGHCIRTDLNYRPIHFEIKVDNPIPIDLHITEYKCEIYYRTMLILPDARLTEDVPRLVKREAKSDRLYVEYNPITQRLGIPRDPNGWELRCRFTFSCNLGKFTKIVEGKAQTVANISDWSKTREELTAWFASNS